MLKGFRSKALAELWARGHSKRISPALAKRILRRLEAMSAAESLRDLDVPGFDCHPLKGTNPQRHSVWVNGPWRVTFVWIEQEGPDAIDLEQYH